jgi:hypothetical protein
MTYYNYYVTGNPLVLPYQHNARTYAFVPSFVWQPLEAEHEYNHEVIRDYHVYWAKPKYLELQEPARYVSNLGTRLTAFLGFFLGLVLLVPLLCLPKVVRNRWMLWAALTCALELAALSVTTWFQPHYAAPITGLVFVLAIQGLRHLRLSKWAGVPIGRCLVQVIPATYACSVLLAGAMLAQTDDDSWYRQRARITARLEQDGRRHLIVVQYQEGHSPIEEWVFNQADIDAAPVVWARDMGVERNRRLLDYFRDRRVWLLDADAEPPELRPYPSLGTAISQAP